MCSLPSPHCLIHCYRLPRGRWGAEMQGGVGSVFTFRKDKQRQQHPPPTSSAPKKPASPRQWASLTAHTTARPHSPRSLIWKPSLPGLRRNCCVQIATSHKFGSSKWSPWEAELHSGISNSPFKSYIPFPPPAPEASLTTTLTLVRIGPEPSSPLRSGTQEGISKY